MPRLLTPAQLVARNKLRVARNTQLVAGNKQLAARNMMLVARNKLRWCKRSIRGMLLQRAAYTACDTTTHGITWVVVTGDTQ